jgi:DNA repair protein RadC
MPFSKSVQKVRLRTVRDGRGVRFTVEKVTRPRDVYEAVRPWYRGLDREALGVLALDTQNTPIAWQLASLGSLNVTRTHPREIFKLLILVGAAGFVCVHNHPSGSLEPSDEDIEFTRAIQRAGELIGIELFDHLIVTDSGFTSLRERGAL